MVAVLGVLCISFEYSTAKFLPFTISEEFQKHLARWRKKFKAKDKEQGEEESLTCPHTTASTFHSLALCLVLNCVIKEKREEVQLRI